MPKYRRMKHMEKSNGASGEDPEFGAIFMSSKSTMKECLRKELFGLPIGEAGFVKQVKAGMILFLFEFESRELHGVFQACSDGAINIDPNAFRSSGKQFPAQVKFTEKWRCRPLRESEFRHAIRENYFTAKKFKFGLSEAQVQRLLELFSLKKVEQSRLGETSATKPTRKPERDLRITVGDRSVENRDAGEMGGDGDREFPLRVTSAGDRRGRRLTENYGFGDESDISLEYGLTEGNKYSGDTSRVCRRLSDPKLHGSKDRVGYEVRMNNSYGEDAFTNNSLVNDPRVPENLRHTASGWLENEYHDKDGIAQASLRSNDKEHLYFEADPVGPAQSSVPPDLPYRTNTGYYNPYEPGIMGDATMKSSRHDLGAPNVDLIGSDSFTANSNYGLGEEIIPVGGYVSDPPFEIVQPFSDEHNGTSMNTGNLGLDYYIPMPTEHREYHTNTGMYGVPRGESESESRNDHMCHSQFPGHLSSARATENMRTFERPPYSEHNIFPSFSYPLSSRDLSPNDGLNNEIPTYQHQEELGGHVSYTNDRLVRGSSIYPSFTYPSTLGDGAALYPENRTNNEVQAYQRHEESGRDAFDSNNRVTQKKDHVNPDELERSRTIEKTRESVFKRLGKRSKERDAEMDTSPDTESVDEVMAFLNDCHKHWMEQKRPNMSDSEEFVKPKKKKGKICTAEVLDNDLMLPFTETTPDDLLDCEGSMEHSVQKLPFIDFKRRSKAQKSLGNPTQGCKDSPEHSASPNKKRKLLRPKLIEGDSEKDKGNKDDSVKNVFASEKDRGKNDDPIENCLASQSATEVPVHDFLGCNEGDLQNDGEKNDDPIENCLASQSATEVPVHDFLGRNDGDSQKDGGKNDDPIENCLASQSATEVPVHDILGRNEGDSQKDGGNNNDDPIENCLASTEVPVHKFLGCNEGDSQKNGGNNENCLASQSATEVPVHKFLGCNEGDSQKNGGNNDDPIDKVLASVSATEVPVHDFLGSNEGDSQKDGGKNDDPIENCLASQSATEVPVHDFLGRNEGDSQKDGGKNDDPIENCLASQSATEVPVHNFLGRSEGHSQKDGGNNDDPIDIVLASVSVTSVTEVPFHDFL